MAARGGAADNDRYDFTAASVHPVPESVYKCVFSTRANGRPFGCYADLPPTTYPYGNGSYDDPHRPVLSLSAERRAEDEAWNAAVERSERETRAERYDRDYGDSTYNDRDNDYDGQDDYVDYGDYEPESRDYRPTERRDGGGTPSGQRDGDHASSPYHDRNEAVRMIALTAAAIADVVRVMTRT